MKRILKIGVVLVLLVVGMIVISTVALRVLLPKEKAKALILKQMTGQLKREVRLNDVSVGILSGLSVTDLKVSEAPDFSKGTFLSSDGFSVKLALWPLLFRKVVVKQLILTRPMINVVRMADGKTFNFSDLMNGGTVPKQQPDASLGPSPTSPPFALLVSHADIEKGIVRFIDKSPAQQSVDIDPLDLKLRNVSLISPFSVQVALTAKARQVVADLKLAGEANIITGSFKIKTCTLSSGGSLITLAGKADQLKSNQPSVDLELNIKEFRLATLAPFMSLPPALRMEGPLVGNAKIRGDQKKINLESQLDLEKVQVVYGKQFSKPAKVPMSFSLRGALVDLKNLEIAELKAVLATLQLKGHGKVFAVASAEPQVSLHIESNAFSVADVMALAPASLPPGITIKGRAQMAADVSGTQSSSHLALKLDGKDLAIAKADQFVKPEGMPLRITMVGESIQRSIAKSKTLEQVLNIQTLGMTLGSLELTGNGSIQTAATPPRFQLAFKSNTFSLQDVSNLVPMLAAYQLSGKASMDVRTSGTSAAPLANGTLNLQNASLRYEQSELTQLNSVIGFTHQDVSIPKLTGKLNGSDLNLKLTGRKLTTAPDVNVEGNIAEVDLAKLLPPSKPSSPAASGRGSMDSPPVAGNDRNQWIPSVWAASPPAATPPAKLSGHLVVGRIKHPFYDAKDLDAKWNLTDVTPDLSKISGSMDVQQGPGKLQELEKLVETSKSMRVALLPVSILQKLDKKGLLKSIPGMPSLQTLTFQTIQGKYALRSGLMDIQKFQISGEALSMETVGSMGLAGEQTLDLRIAMRLAQGVVRGSVGQFMTDQMGRVNLTFSVKGTVADPHVRLDMTDTGRNVLNNLGAELFKKLGGGNKQPEAPAPNAGEGSVPPSPPDQEAPAQPAQPSTNQDVGKELEKALKNIFK